jgi:hypothetical protein
MQLSDRRTKRSFEKSSRALARRRFSASTSDTDPHSTSWRGEKNKKFICKYKTSLLFAITQSK